MDINEALTFDPESTELRFCEPDESPNANALLMSYLNDFISIEANGQRIPIKLENKSLKGEGINTALQISFEYPQQKPLKTLKIKNTVFTDLFFDQTNTKYSFFTITQSYTKRSKSPIAFFVIKSWSW